MQLKSLSSFGEAREFQLLFLEYRSTFFQCLQSMPSRILQSFFGNDGFCSATSVSSLLSFLADKFLVMAKSYVDMDEQSRQLLLFYSKFSQVLSTECISETDFKAARYVFFRYNLSI